MSRRRRQPTPAIDRLVTGERAQLLAELLEAHPELVGEAEGRALARLAVADVDAVAESIERALRGADVGQLAHRAGRVRGRGYVHENEAAGEILDELLQPDLADLARRAAIGLHDAAGQIGLGLLRGLGECRTAVADGTVLAYAGPDVTDGMAWSVCDALARAGVSLPDDAFDRLPTGWSRLRDP